MLKYCLKYIKFIENLNSKVTKIKNIPTVLLSKCAVCSKKSRFMKEQEVKEIFSSLVFKTPLRKVPLLCDILF